MKQLSIITVVFLSFIYFQTQGQTFQEINKIPVSPVKDQARAGTCWSFATLSFIESELLRTSNTVYDISETYFAYYGYINKAIYYVRLQGKNNFGQGGQAHDVMDIIKKHGIVPEKIYPYNLKDHTELEKTLKNYLDSIIRLKITPKNWLVGYEKILSDQLGEIPTKFQYEGKEYTPQSFSADKLKINPNDYVEITSYSHHPFYEQFILEVPDNWSHSNYYNVPINDLIDIINSALKNNYSVVWDGDVSEKGFNSQTATAKIDAKTTYPKTKKEIQKLRQELFDQKLTTDDHLMHLTGRYKNKEDDFYLIKNSWAAYGPYKGYLYMSKKFTELKTIAILLNKNAIPEKIKNKLNIR